MRDTIRAEPLYVSSDCVTALHVVLDGRVLWVLLAPVTPIHLTLYMFPETVSLLCMWYSTAAVVPGD